VWAPDPLQVDNGQNHQHKEKDDSDHESLVRPGSLCHGLKQFFRLGQATVRIT